MSSSLSNYVEGLVMSAVFNGTSAAALQLTNRYIQLHTGDPTKDGSANVAGNSLRKLIFGAPPTGGLFVSVADIVWTAVPTAETYSHASLWDALSAGNCLWVGSLVTPKQVQVGDTYTIPAGAFTATLL